ncbi:EamA family transporter, partial [Roseibium sp. RKSG952]|uniref:EamA family transporter n=1 Tax=Roseibium sp. RKSG952 TaxID=2529384 RepID=UPI0012BCF33F
KPLLLSTGMMTVSFLALLVLACLLQLPLLPHHITGAGLSVLTAQIVLYAIQYTLYFQLQKQAGPVVVGQIGSVQAAIGIPLAMVLFHEIPSLPQLAAIALVLTAIILVNQRHTPRPKA